MNRPSTIGYQSDAVDGVLCRGAANARDRNRR
jgi:hypothetical protein